ncbi:WD40 repeat-like protein [Polyporus arcularius HHB13444]|uniref:WD40 repeat-like protein n=1 Tax=Polyporus arcularius HHB13444 TaxID=1314778 RepID=A0A5C3P3T5_9APHY|nr:WD40 repeat-like protein [Polyporus arcularius HHB13444]
MVLRYLESACLSRGHTGGITALAFSPAGKFLASAGLEGKVCIWRADDFRLLHVVSRSGGIAVLSLAWLSPNEETLICGLKDGNIVFVTVNEQEVTINGFWAHKYPVECLVVAAPDLFVSGAHTEVRVWKRSIDSHNWLQQADLPLPPTTSFNRLDEVQVTSLHVIGYRQPLLVVTYMNHGMHLFDASTWEHRRSIPITGQIGDTSFSPDFRTVAVSNIIRGFDVYSMDTETALCSFGHAVKLDNLRRTPVLLIHDGLALLGGNTQGDVHIWDVGSRRKLHSLVHHKEEVVLAIAAHYYEDSDTFVIATGILEGGTRRGVVVWHAQELSHLHVVTSRSFPAIWSRHGWNFLIIGIILGIVSYLYAAATWEA